MEVLYEGKTHVLTPDFIMRVGGIGRKAAKNRIKAFISERITIEQLLFKGSYTNHAVEITKDGHTWTAPALAKVVPRLTVTAANKRLQKWKAGKIPYKNLFAPLNASTVSHTSNKGTKEWRMLDDRFIKRNPDDIKVTPFELEYGEKKERDWGYVDASY